MLYSVKELFRPERLEDALRYLSEHPDARPLAGGTDVLVDLRRRRPEDVRLVSLEKLPELLKSCIRKGSLQELIDYANNRGGSDNITAVVLYRQ